MEIQSFYGVTDMTTEIKKKFLNLIPPTLKLVTLSLRVQMQVVSKDSFFLYDKDKILYLIDTKKAYDYLFLCIGKQVYNYLSHYKS